MLLAFSFSIGNNRAISQNKEVYAKMFAEHMTSGRCGLCRISTLLNFLKSTGFLKTSPLRGSKIFFGRESHFKLLQ